MGFDGILVEGYTRPRSTTDINTVGMEFAHILTQVKRAAELLEVGAVEEMTLQAEHLTVALRVISEEYFLAFVFAPSASLGKARYLLRLSVPAIAAEL